MSRVAVASRDERGGALSTLVRGLRLSPELRVGLGVTLALAVVATAGRLIVPVVLQRLIDSGFTGGGSVTGIVATLAAVGATAIVVTAAAGAAMNRRLARVTETALSALRVRAFRHLHDLSALHLAAEQRGVLVARVTADVDTISQFMQWGGLMLLVSSAQLVLAGALMAFYSWQLLLVVMAVFAPLLLLLRLFQSRLEVAYDRLRVRVGAMLGALGESVVGAEVIRAYGVEDRTRQRVEQTIEAQYRAAYGAGRLGVSMFATSEGFAGLAAAAAVVVGVVLGVDGGIARGELLAFLFLVTLFISPVQLITEVLDQAQTAVAGWRRVLDLLAEVPDIPDPAHDPRRTAAAVDLPDGALEVRFEHVGYAYPARDRGAGLGAPVLVDVDLDVRPRTRVAVVGETGSGKSTFARLLTRLVDPTQGRVRIGGCDLRDVRFASLRRRVVLVPQDGFLFDTTIAENVRYGRPGSTDADVTEAFARLGLAEWLEALPESLVTPVGERGDRLSAGERQLVALARAWLADPELLVLDEATSAVDPVTEARLQRALDELTRGRTSVAIAHRLSTAVAADEIVVFDRGRVVQRGPHTSLVAVPGIYAGLHASWVAGREQAVSGAR